MKMGVLLLSALWLAGCAGGPPAVRLKASERGPGPEVRAGQPVIIEFQEGDEIPLQLTVSGGLVESPPGLAPVVLRARRRFFVKIDGGSIKTSLDGEHFESSKATQGSLAFGFGFERGAGPKASIAIKTPEP